MDHTDKIIEEKYDVPADSFSDKKILDFIKEKEIRCPNCKGSFGKEIDLDTKGRIS